MTDPNPPKSLKRVWVGALILVIILWIIYAVAGGPAIPKSETGSAPAAETR
jgi:hypothetical protein